MTLVRLQHKPMKVWLYRLVLLGVLTWGTGMISSELTARLVNLPRLREGIQDDLAFATGLNVNVGMMRIQPTLFEGLRVDISQIRFSEGSRPVAYVDRFYLWADYLPLIQQKILQLHKIQLRDVQLLGGQEGVFNTRYPFLEKDFLMRFKKRHPDAMPTRFEDMSVQARSVALVSNVVLPDTRELLRTKKTQITDRRLELSLLNIHHLASAQPVSVQARWVFYKDRQIFHQLETTAECAPWTLLMQDGTATPPPLASLFHLSGKFKDNEGSDLQGNLVLKEKTGWLHPIRSVTQPSLSVKSSQVQLDHLATDYNEVLPLLNSPLIHLRPLNASDVHGYFTTTLDAGYQGDLATDISRQQFSMDKLNFKPGGITLNQVRYMPWVSDMTGLLAVHNKTLSMDKMALHLLSVPVTLDSAYDLKNGQTTLQLNAKSINLKETQASLKPLSGYFPGLMSKLSSVKVDGLADLTLSLKGILSPDQSLRLSQPVWQQQSLDGALTITKGTIQDVQSGLDVSDMLVKILIGPDVSIQKFTGYFASAPFSIDGHFTPDFKTADIHFLTESVDLKSFYTALKTKLSTQAWQKSGLDSMSLENLTGQGLVDLRYQQVAGAHPELSGKIQMHQIVWRPSEATAGIAASSDAIVIPGLLMTVANNQMQLSNLDGQWGPIPFHLAMKGKIPLAQLGQSANGSLLTDWSMAFSTEPIAIAQFRDKAAFFKAMMPSALRAQYPDIWNAQGTMAIKADATEASQNISMIFNQAGVSAAGMDFPLYDVNGQLLLAIHQKAGVGSKSAPLPEARLTASGLTFRYGNSRMKLSAQQSGKLQASLMGVLSPLVVNHYLTAPQGNYAPYREVPFKLALDGFNGMMDLDLNHMLLEHDDDEASEQLSAVEDIQATPSDLWHDHDPASNVGLNARFSMQDNLQRLKIDSANLHLAEMGDLWLSGLLNMNALQNARPDSTITQLHLTTKQPINLDGIGKRFRQDLFGETSGHIQADLDYQNTIPSVSAASGQPDFPIKTLNGSVNLDAVKIPSLSIDNITGAMQFNQQHGDFNFPVVQIPGMSMKAQGQTENSLSMPVPLDNVAIEGSVLDVASLQNFSKSVVDKIIVRELVQRFIRPWQEGDPIVPVVFKDANIKVDEVIYQNILMQNMAGKLSVYGNGFFELSDAQVNVAQGKANIYLSMSPMDDNFMTAAINMDGVKANAVTRALLKVSNQIFGDVNGAIRFTTQGVTDRDMLANANGSVKMKISNGRLPAVAQLETLLTAANILRGGILGLNLNNLVRTVAPFKTNYFAEMSGDLLIAEKKLYAENLLSNGENLDLSIRGTLGLDDGVADMLIFGRMAQNVSGALGKLGKLNLAELFRSIPIIGYIPGKQEPVVMNRTPSTNSPFPNQSNANGKYSTLQYQPGLIYRIPGLGYIPGVGGPARDVNRFRVRLAGPVQDPASVKDFKWVVRPTRIPASAGTAGTTGATSPPARTTVPAAPVH